MEEKDIKGKFASGGQENTAAGYVFTSNQSAETGSDFI